MWIVDVCLALWPCADDTSEPERRVVCARHPGPGGPALSPLGATLLPLIVWAGGRTTNKKSTNQRSPDFSAGTSPPPSSVVEDVERNINSRQRGLAGVAESYRPP